MTLQELITALQDIQATYPDKDPEVNVWDYEMNDFVSLIGLHDEEMDDGSIGIEPVTK